MNNETYQGVLPDNRPETERANDFTFDELVASAAPVKWDEKKQYRKYPIYDQGNSGSCVAQTLRKLQSIHFHNQTGVWVDLSASHIYQRRSNRPQGGMIGIDSFKIAQQGVTLEQFAPSHRLTDSQMDALVVHEFMAEVGKSFAIGNYLTVLPDIDTIASIIQQTGKGVMVWFYFNLTAPNREWSDVPEVMVPNLNMYASTTSRHSVTAVDFTMYKGKKALIIDDSWGLTSADEGQRIITEDFFKARCYFAAHFMNFKFESPSAPKTGTFTTDLEFGQRSADVARLQLALKDLGHFPANVYTTGYYGNVTKTAVGAFQLAHGVASKGTAGFGRFGPLTRAKLNSIIE